MSLDKKNPDKNNIVQFSDKKEDLTFLGHYIPVHKSDEFISEKKQKVSSPFEKPYPKTTFSIYDGDYLNASIDENFLYKKSNNKIVQAFKNFMLSLPFFNIIFLKIQQSEIQKTISRINIMSDEIDRCSKFLSTHAIINDKKYDRIKNDLKSSSVLQTKMQKDFFEKY